MKYYNFLIITVTTIIISSCEKKQIVVTPDDFHNAIENVTQVIIHDIFSPPVASRIYTYPNVAAYEILALHNPEFTSLAGQVNGLTPIPEPVKERQINPEVAALVSHMELSKRLIFSEDRIEKYRDSLYAVWKDQDEEVFTESKNYGLAVADHIAKWMDKDNYKQTRTMAKFSVYPDNPSRWQPTPPAYMDGIEPHWMEIRPFVIDSSSQFKPLPPPAFSMEESSDFHKELLEVYNINKAIIAEGETSEKLAIAQFWDCNPYVSTHKGHLMFATKKITPGGHWIGITKIACRKADLDVMHTMYAYTKTSMAMADAFISCWEEKYRSNLIRPETLINQTFDDSWVPILQTPPFPEYSSGHSVVSGAAAEALTSIFGDDFAFDDDTETPYGLPVRHFTSFRQASSEAAISRLYGGIHYRAACEQGLKQGRALGDFVVGKLKMDGKEDEPVVSSPSPSHGGE